MDKCTEIFLLVIFPLIRQVIVCSIKKRFSCDESRLQSDNLVASITEENWLDDNSKYNALLASCTSSSSSLISLP